MITGTDSSCFFWGHWLCSFVPMHLAVSTYTDRKKSTKHCFTIQGKSTHTLTCISTHIHLCVCMSVCVLESSYCIHFLRYTTKYHIFSSLKPRTFLISQCLLVRSLGTASLGLLLRVSQACNQRVTRLRPHLEVRVGKNSLPGSFYCWLESVP